MTPFNATKGYNPIVPTDFIAKELSERFPAGKQSQQAQNYLDKLNANLTEAETAMNLAALTYKTQSDKLRVYWQDGMFEIGKQVLLSTANIQDVDTISKDITNEGMVAATRKLMPLFIGPFKVKSMRGPSVSIPAKRNSKGKIIREVLERQVTVELELPKHFQISPIRHVSELRPYFKRQSGFNTVTDIALPPAFERDGESFYYVKRILKHDSRTNSFLVEWEGYSENTWEPAANLQEHALASIDEYFAAQPRDVRRSTRQTKRGTVLWMGV
jgi:hypothetical protein